MLHQLTALDFMLQWIENLFSSRPLIVVSNDMTCVKQHKYILAMVYDKLSLSLESIRSDNKSKIVD